MFESVLKVIRGIVKLRGGTDGSIIGNTGNKLNVSATLPDYSNTLVGSKKAIDVNLLKQSGTETFGANPVVYRKSQFSNSFLWPFASQYVTITTSGGASITQPAESAVLSSSTATTASAKLQSGSTVYYQPGKEIYVQVTAAFTTPTSANSSQKVGIYDTLNGFWIGYNGTTFGVAVRYNGTDTFIPQTSFNGDLLDGSASSNFTRGAVPEALNKTFKNLFRIRFGWLGSAPIIFEIASPDGGYIIFHTIRQPNTASTSSVLTPNLPITGEIIKTSADATNLQMIITCWEAGTASIPDMDMNGYASINGAGQTLVVTSSHGVASVNFSLSGTWVGTFVVESSLGDGNWYLAEAFSSSDIDITSISVNSLITVPTSGESLIRLRATSWTSGTANIVWVTSHIASNSAAHVADGVGNNITSTIDGTKRRLDVATTITGFSGGVVSNFSSKLRYVDMNASNGGVARGTSITNAAWVDVFSYTGSGNLTNFLLNIEGSADWLVRLVVDGEELFGSAGLAINDVTGDSLYDLDPSGKSVSEDQDSFGVFQGTHDVFRWSGPLYIPVKYTSSVAIKITRAPGAAAKKFQAGFIILSKDT